MLPSVQFPKSFPCYWILLVPFAEVPSLSHFTLFNSHLVSHSVLGSWVQGSFLHSRSSRDSISSPTSATDATLAKSFWSPLFTHLYWKQKSTLTCPEHVLPILCKDYIYFVAVCCCNQILVLLQVTFRPF